MVNAYFVAVLVLLVLDALLDLLVDVLNLRHIDPRIPPEFADVVQAGRYERSQHYLRDTTRFDMVSTSLRTVLLLLFIVLGGFGWADALARAAGAGMIPTGLLFTAVLLLLSAAVRLPFDAYDTFVLEERYGFNRTTWRTFLLDKLKVALLAALIGAPVFVGVLWFFARTGPWGWAWAWAGVTAVQLLLAYAAPAFILPVFNRFTPLEPGELRAAIEDYAGRQRFRLKGIYTIDGSRRSTKSNAYFTGFGRWKRIALYDTLVARHPVPELVAVLAHEVGHYRLGHVRKLLAGSVATTGLLLFLLSLFLHRPGLYAAFQVPYAPVGGQPPIYAGFVFFGFLFTPISLLVGLATNALSRRYEFAADRFAARTTGRPDAMAAALKKLSVDSLSNLTPHPLKVALAYSHPPVLQRIRALRAGAQPPVDEAPTEPAGAEAEAAP